MYLRHTTRKKDGKVHRYWRLVRSVRVGRRVIQQTVAQLGELDEHGQLQARAFARSLIGAPEQAELFDDGSAALTVPVRLKGIRIERSRQFGDVYLGLALWRGTGLSQLCEQLLPSGKERVAWEKMAAVLVTARLCEPSSELHIAEDWYRRTALADLLQLDDAQVNKDRLYRALDELLAHKGALEAHLARRCGELFAIDNEVLLYDVTSTFFEGQAEANPLAQRGYSRDHRPDCKQVCIALVVSFDGFPLGYEVFPGNMNDSRTLQTIVTTMEARHGVIGRVWIGDRGMASAANLAWLREGTRRYIIGAPKAELKKFASALASATGWRALREGIEVKLTCCPETRDTIILCRSAERRSKERAMHEKFSRRIEAALSRLAERIARSRRRSRSDPGQPPDRPDLATESTRRRALRGEPRPGRMPGRDRAAGHAQRRVRRLGRPVRRGLFAALEHHRLERRAALARLHPTLAGRGRLPHPEGSAARAPDLASARRSGAGTHPGVLPCLRALEEPGAVATTRRPGQLTAHRARGACAHPIPRRHLADPDPRRHSPALHHSTRPRPSRIARAARYRLAQAHAPDRTRSPRPRAQRLSNPLVAAENVVPTSWLSP